MFLINDLSCGEMSAHGVGSHLSVFESESQASCADLSHGSSPAG
jgi:hypothetical protein